MDKKSRSTKSNTAIEYHNNHQSHQTPTNTHRHITEKTPHPTSTSGVPQTKQKAGRSITRSPDPRPPQTWRKGSQNRSEQPNGKTWPKMISHRPRWAPQERRTPKRIRTVTDDPSHLGDLPGWRLACLVEEDACARANVQRKRKTRTTEEKLLRHDAAATATAYDAHSSLRIDRRRRRAM